MLLPLFLSSDARLLVAKSMGRGFTDDCLLLMRDIVRPYASAYFYGDELHFRSSSSQSHYFIQDLA
jgi:hypothetical protein